VDHLRVLLRFDVGGLNGLGHAIRSIAIGQHLQSRGGVEVLVCGETSPLLTSLLASSGMAAIAKARTETEEAFLERLAEAYPGSVLFIDHLYLYSKSLVAELRHQVRVIFFHNDCEGVELSDAVIFPIAHLDELTAKHLHSRLGSRFFSGFDFVVINEKVKSASIRARNATSPYLAIVAGGTDPTGMLSVLLDWLADSRLTCPVIGLYGLAAGGVAELRQRFSNDSESNVRVCSFSYSELFAAHLVISAFGVTAYELIYRNVPVACVGLHEKSALGSERLAKKTGAILNLGDFKFLNSEQVIQTVSDLWGGEKRDTLSSSQIGKIDGRGVERVSDVILQLAAS